MLVKYVYISGTYVTWQVIPQRDKHLIGISWVTLFPFQYFSIHQNYGIFMKQGIG